MAITLVSLLVFIVMWLLFYYPIRDQKGFEMDFGENPGTGTVVFALYQRLFWSIFFVGIAESFVCVARRLTEAGSVLFLAVTAAMLFNGLLPYFYEEYLHVKYYSEPHLKGKTTYVPWKYSLILALGFSSVFLFVFGTALALFQVAALAPLFQGAGY